MTRGKSKLFTNDNAIPFFGKITASFTHDLNNIISIIDQSAGLMEDLLPGVARGSEVPAERFAAIAEKIRKHAARGIALIRHLNTFAHGVDHPVATININDVITNLKALSGRLLSNKGVEMDLNFMHQDCELRNNAFMIQQIVFIIIEIILANANKGDIIKVSTSKENFNVNVAINAHFAEKVSQINFDVTSKLADLINGVIDMRMEEKTLSVCLRISDLKSEYDEQ